MANITLNTDHSTQQRSSKRLPSAQTAAATPSTTGSRAIQPSPALQANPNDVWPRFDLDHTWHHMFKDLQYVDFPGRAKYLPPLYKYQGVHPLRHLYPIQGDTYVYVRDPSEQGIAQAQRNSQLSEIPSGNLADMKELGKQT